MTDAPDHEVLAVDLDDDGRPEEEVPLDVVRSGLANDDDQVRARAATVGAGVALRDRDRAADLAPALCEGVRDDHSVVVYKSVLALSFVAEDYPDRVKPAVGRLVELLDHEVPNVRTRAARTLAAVVDDDPGAFTDHVDGLVDGLYRELDDVVDTRAAGETRTKSQAQKIHRLNREYKLDRAEANQSAAGVLVEVADHDPAALAAHVPDLVELLSVHDVAVLTAVVDALGSVAEHDPDAVAEAVDPLVDLLDHPNDGVVATAAAALGFAGDPAAVDPLRTVASDEDRHEDLRDLAEETADFLAAR